MNRKLFLAILLVTLYFEKIQSQGPPPCTAPQIINPADPTTCYCSNKAGTVCGAGKSFNDAQCGCECSNKATLSPTCLPIAPFDEVTCTCKCTNKDTTTCKSPFVYRDSPKCNCGCPNEGTVCTCAGVTFDNTKCGCFTPTSKCKGVVYNCATGKFDTPPKPNKCPSDKCLVYDQTKCDWVAPKTCPAGQRLIEVNDTPTTKTCDCAKIVEGCDIYVPNPAYDSTNPKSEKYICQSCKFPQIYKSSSKECCDCDDYQIKVYDSSTNSLLGYLTFSGVLNQKPNDAKLAIVPGPLPASITSKNLDKFVIRKQTAICPDCYFIRGRLSLPQRLYLRWNSDPKLFLSSFENQPKTSNINDQMLWNIETDQIQNSLKTFRGKLNSKLKEFTVKKDLTMDAYSSLPATEYNFEFNSIC